MPFPKRAPERTTYGGAPIARRALLTAIPAAAALAACSKPSRTSSAASGSTVQLTYAIWDATFKPGLQQVVTKFNQANPKIQVTIQPTTGDAYWTKMQAAATSGNAPDLFWMNEPNFLEYALNGQLVPLSDLIKKDNIDTDKFPDGLVKAYQANGKQYALPWINAMVGLWYNKEMFDKRGIKHPDDTWDWSSVQQAAPELTNAKHGIFGIAADMQNQLNYYNTILQAGGFIVSPDLKKSGFDSPEAISGIQFWIDFIKNNSSPTLQQMTDTTAEKMFESQKLAMFYGGSWEAGTFGQIDGIKDKIAVAQLPIGKRRGTTVEGASNVIYAKTKHPDEAWEFLKFMETATAQTIQAKTGIVLPAYAGTQKPWVESEPSYKLQNLVNELTYASPYPHSKNTAAWQNHEADFLTPAWSLKEDVPTACRKLAAAMNADLVKEG